MRTIDSIVNRSTHAVGNAIGTTVMVVIVIVVVVIVAAIHHGNYRERKGERG